MKFILTLIAVYVYFSAALLNSLKNFSYSEPALKNTLLMENTEPAEIINAKVAMAKTASFVEKSGYPL